MKHYQNLLLFILLNLPFLSISQISTSGDCTPAVLETASTSFVSSTANSLVANFVENTNNPTGNTFAAFSPPLSITYTFQNLQYGTFLRFKPTEWDNLCSVGIGCTSSFWTSVNSADGTGIDGTNSGNYGAAFIMQPDPLSGTAPTEPQYYGDIVITFSSPVDNPILHIEDLGGTAGEDYSAFFDVTTSPGTSTLSGFSTNETGFNVTSSTITASSLFREGSVQVNGLGITSITLSTSLNLLSGTFGTSTVGEQFVIGASLLSYTGSTNSISGNVTDSGTPANISGVSIDLYYDLDADGVLDAEDITAGVVASTTTDGSGNYSFTGLASDDYLVVETQPAAYTNISDGDTSPDGSGDVSNLSTTDDIIPVSVCGNEADADNNFIEFLSILPVKLLSFSGNSENENVLLKWSTASELNNSHFEIERSLNNLHFKSVGKVSGNGNSNEVINYTFLDRNVPSGKLYYRLKQIDFNGHYEYSDVISVLNSRSSRVNTYFDSVNKVLNVSGSSNSDRVIRILTIDGRLLNTITRKSESESRIPLDGFMPGIYIVHVMSEGLSNTEKIIVN